MIQVHSFHHTCRVRDTCETSSGPWGVTPKESSANGCDIAFQTQKSPLVLTRVPNLNQEHILAFPRVTRSRLIGWNMNFFIFIFCVLCFIANHMLIIFLFYFFMIDSFGRK